MSLISEELEQIKVAPGAWNKLLLLIVTGRLTGLLSLLVALLAVIFLGVALLNYPNHASTVIEWLGIIGSAMGLGSQATSLGHSALNKIKGVDHVHSPTGEPIPVTGVPSSPTA